MRKLTNEEVIKEFINRLKTRKSNFYVEYHDGKIKKISLPGITINLDKETINFDLGLEEFCGFNYVAEEIKVIKEFINGFQTAKENNGNNRIEDTTSLINGE